MNMRRKDCDNFTQIFTCLHFRVGEISQRKNPYIVFKIPVITEEDNQYYQQIKKSKLSSLGLIKLENNEFTITITSASKVIHAIDIFSSLNEYSIDDNAELFKSLDEYKYQCRLIQESKNIKSIPTKSKCISQFEIEEHSSLPQTSNDTCLIRKKFSKKK